jgi:very-short-patch-repair endonuclease
VPVPPARPSILRRRVFRESAVVAAGVLTRDQLRSAAWRQLRRDVYADADLPVDHRLLACGVSLAAPPNAVFGGLTAVVLAGGHEFAGPDDPVEVVLPPGERWQPGPGVVSRSASLAVDVVRGRQGLRRTGPVRTAVDLIRRGVVDDGVVLLDRLVANGLVALGPVRDAVAALPQCRGSRLAREIVDLADGCAESPQETRLRLLMRRAGLPTPSAQYRVFDQKGFIARVDFAYPELRLAIEYDGAWQGGLGQVGRDRRRLNRLSAAGWRVVFVTAVDLYDPERLVAQLIAAMAR